MSAGVHVPRAQRGRAARAGFTIIELTVAMTIGAVIALTAYGAMGTLGDALARARGDGRPALAAVTARQALAGWLHGATLGGGVEGFVGVRRLGLDGRLDELAFAVGDGGALRPGSARVRLFVDRDPATTAEGLVAELAPRGGALPAIGRATAETLEVVPRAVGLAVRYRATPAAAWVDAWPSAHRLPAVVELRVVADPAALRDGRFPPLLALPIVATPAAAQP